MKGKMSHRNSEYSTNSLFLIVIGDSRSDIGLAGLANRSEQICVVSTYEVLRCVPSTFATPGTDGWKICA